MAACAEACSGSTTNGQGEAGGASGSVAGSGGASGRAGGLGGLGGFGTVLPEGALSATVGPPAVPVAQMACPIVLTYEIGAPDAPTTANPGESVVSGSNSSTVTCSVLGQGQFTFSGSLHAVTAQGDMILIAFSNGSIAADGTGSTDVNFYSPQLATNFTGTACSVTVENQQVKPGAIWASFQCSQITSPPSGLCGLQGVFVFENCTGSLQQ